MRPDEGGPSDQLVGPAGLEARPEHLLRRRVRVRLVAAGKWIAGDLLERLRRLGGEGSGSLRPRPQKRDPRLDQLVIPSF